MDTQEQFFQDQIHFIHEAIEEKEESFEKLHQQQRLKVKQSNLNPSNTKRRADEIANFIKSQDQEIESFVAKRDKLTKTYEEKMAAMRQRHRHEEVELERSLILN